MPAGKINLLIEQGATFVLPIEVYESDGTTPRDLTDVTEIRMQIRPDIDSAQKIADFDLTDSAEFAWDDQENGQFTLTVSATVTAAISVRSAVYDLELVFSTGVIERLLQGGIEFSPEVTR